VIGPARHWLAAVVLMVALAVALAACSGGKSNNNKTATAGTNADAAELNQLSDKFSKSTFKAQYKLSSTGGDQPLDGTLVMFKDGADRFRFDITSKQQGAADVALTLIDTKDASVFCLQDAGDLAPILGVDKGKGVCLKNDPTNSAGGLADITQNFKDLASSDTTVTNKSTRSIAGQDARCFDYKTKGSNDTNQTCFSADGIPLYDKSVSSTDTTVMEATSVEGAVQASDFNVPYEVKEIPGAGTPAP
jgi:hypothetical protein